jgi:hypothetical protein
MLLDPFPMIAPMGEEAAGVGEVVNRRGFRGSLVILSLSHARRWQVILIFWECDDFQCYMVAPSREYYFACVMSFTCKLNVFLLFT